jgi:hypothetical protein
MMIVQMEIRGWRDRSDLIAQIRSAKKNDVLKIMVVTNQTEWTPDWVTEASKQANVAKGLVRPVFIGGAKHALTWSSAHPLGTKTPSRVRIELLRPWARSYLASRLYSIDALRSPLVDKILQLTGGWNDPCQTLATHDAQQGGDKALPKCPTLAASGIGPSDLAKIAGKLNPDTWLDLSLTRLEDEPVFEYRVREGDYIPFANASAGQQATALLKALLNQSGPPLIIDQPEEDLDNPVILEVVQQTSIIKLP